MSKLEKCPVCDGRGFVKGNFYDIAGETCSFGDYAKKQQLSTICMYCNGNGVVNVGYKRDGEWALLSCLMIVAFNDKEYSVGVMKRYLEENQDCCIREDLQNLIDDFEKDLRGEE